MQSKKLFWLRGSRAAAFLLGFSSLFGHLARATPARADHSGPYAPPEAVDATLRLDGGMVYLAQRGGAFEPLALGDTQAGRRLLDLLRRRGPHPIELAPTVVADGAQGFSLDRRNLPPPAATKPETGRSGTGKSDARKPAPPGRRAASS